MRRGSWLLIGLVSVICVRPSAQSLDERAIRELAGRFFSAYAEEDAAAIAAMVSRRSPHYAALVGGRSATTRSPEAIVATPTFGRIRIQDGRATIEVLVEISMGATSAGVVSAERLLLCERGGDAWRVWNLTPSLGELVDRVIAAPTAAARLAVLELDRDWLASEIGPALIARGDRQFQLGRYADAARTYDAAVEVAEALGDRPGVTAALRGVGNVRLYAGELDSAMAAYRSSLARARAGGDSRDVIRALNGIGNVHAARNDPAEALASYEEAMRMAEDLGDESSIATALNNIANVQVSRGRYEEALDRYQRALAIKERAGDGSGLSIGAFNIARVLFLQRRYTEALAYQQRSLALAESLGRTAGVASVHHAIAETYERLEDDARAMHHYQASLDATLRIGDRPTAVENLLAMGRLRLRRGEPAQALASVQRAAEMANSLRRPALEARALDQVGLTQRALSSFAAARTAYENARRLRGDRLDAAAVDGLLDLASLCRDENDNRGALAALEAARDAAREIGDERRAVTALSRIADGHLALQEYALALDAVADGGHLARRIGDANDVVDLEVTAGRTLARLERFNEALAAFDRAIGAAEGGESSAAADISADASAILPGFAPYAAAAELQLSRGRAVDAWRYLERGRAATLRTVLAGDTSGRTVPPLPPTIHVTDVTVGYFVTEHATHIFVFSPPSRGWVATVPVDRRALAATVERVRGVLDGHDRTVDARALYDLLIAPVATSLRSARRIRIVPDGALWRLPFECLENARGRFLIEDHQLSYALFASSAAAVAPDHRPASGGDLLSVGVDGPAAASYPWLAPLYSRDDIPSIQGIADATAAGALVAPERRHALLGADATEAAFAAAAPAYRLLHIAVLARLDDSDPLHSGLLLAPTNAEDGLFDAARIARLQVSANGVVLPSTWQTPDAGARAGLALRVQAWAWRQAGCPQIVVSRATASSPARRVVLQELQRELLQASTARLARDRAAAALQRIERRAIAGTPAGAVPRWSGFMLLSVD